MRIGCSNCSCGGQRGIVADAGACVRMHVRVQMFMAGLQTDGRG